MSMRYLKNVVTLKLDQARCNGCALCLEVCPQEVFARAPEGRKVILRDRDACIECGACAKNCPRDALQVRAGVGCAAALINRALGRTSSDCCCVADGCATTSTTPSSSCCPPKADDPP